MSNISIQGQPTEEEAAAIAAALTYMWPNAQPAGTSENRRNANAWRFSGRWWATHSIVRRARPQL